MAKESQQINNLPIGQQSDEFLEEDALFYNVMPKEQTSSPMVGPKIKVEQAKEFAAHEPNSIMAYIEQHKKLFVFVLALLLLAYPAYYAINKYTLNSGDENILTDEALKNLENKGGNKQPQEPKDLPYKTPTEWQIRFFGSEICSELEKCGDEADPDRDGLKNLEEFNKETDPNNADSDQDGLADGDEVYAFNTQSNNAHTAQDDKYSDGDYIKGGYNPQNKDKLFSAGEIADISAKMKQFGLHQPTLTTLGDSLQKLYKFTSAEIPATNTTSIPAGTNPLEGIDQSPEAKQDRDTQRSNSNKNIAIALVKYYADKYSYPPASSFSDMFNSVKPYIRVATNPVDPINKGQYVYTYAPSSDGRDFTLTFFSETQNQVISVRAADAKKYQEQEEAAVFDDQRKNNLETIRTALLLYSSNHAGGNQEYVFPNTQEYPSVLMPEFITQMPKDPKTNEPYEYKVSESFDSFTLKAVLDAPAPGTTGYLCNQEECRAY